jgi:predicted solute-binding protein
MGFVFAMWMARAVAAEKVRGVDFAAARDEGLMRVDEIAAGYEASLGLPRAELRAYLLENISFEFDEEMRAGLDLFYRLARKHGIIREVRPLKFIGA